MARLPYVDASTASESVREILAGLPALNIFRMMAHAESNFRPLLRLGTSILTEQKLDGKLRELAILQVAARSPAEYEWVQHVAIGKAFGINEEQIDALGRGAISESCFSEQEQIVLAFAGELVRGVRPNEETFARLSAHFSPREIVELVLAIGYYMMLARLMETVQIDIDPPAGVRVLEAARR